MSDPTLPESIEDSLRGSSGMTDKQPRYRYQVTEVWGVMEKQLTTESVVVETEYRGLYTTWDVCRDEDMMSVGGMKGKYLGKVDA